MTKHLLWAGVSLVLAFLGSYVGLTLAGYPEAAQSLGGGGLIFSLVILAGLFFWAMVSL